MAINELRDEFDADPIDEIDPNAVRENIKSPVDTVTTEALQREQPQRELEKLVDWVGRAEENVPDILDQLDGKLSEFEKLESVSSDAQYLELLEMGEDLIEPDADACPLCQQEWDEDTPLIEEIRGRRGKLSNLRELKKSISKNQDELRETLRTGLDPLEYLQKELDPDTYPSVKALEEFQKKLEMSVGNLTDEFPREEKLEIEDSPILLDADSGGGIDVSELKSAVRELREEAAKLPDLSEAEERYERLRSLPEEWGQFEKQNSRISHLNKLEQEVENARSAFVAARGEIVGSIYGEIEQRVDTYYGSIHPDESDSGTSIIVTDTGAELEKDFYDAGEFPPQSVHSEGHLDTLGLCLHLALADYLQQGEKSLLLLDDVVMSVDQDHRLDIARMLAHEFAEEYQMVITTHDELWAEQLRSQGVLRGGNQINLREWSLDGGVVESRGRFDINEQWETVASAMDDDEMEQAAHELRYATERMLQQTSVSLGAKVEYDPRLRHTLGDFKDAVSGRLGTLTGRAKDNLDLSDEEGSEIWDRANELDNAYGSILHNVGQHLDKVNRRVHWTPGKWLTLGPEEFEEVFEAHKKAYDLLYCDKCGSSIRYEEFDNYCELRCNCREHYDIRWS